MRVASGYGRNYLIPKQLAMPVTPGNLKMVEQRRLAAVKREAKYKEEAEQLVQELTSCIRSLAEKPARRDCSSGP